MTERIDDHGRADSKGILPSCVHRSWDRVFPVFEAKYSWIFQFLFQANFFFSLSLFSLSLSRPPAWYSRLAHSLWCQRQWECGWVRVRDKKKEKQGGEVGYWWLKAAPASIHMQIGRRPSTNPWEDKSCASLLFPAAKSPPSFEWLSSHSQPEHLTLVALSQKTRGGGRLY